MSKAQVLWYGSGNYTELNWNWSRTVDSIFTIWCLVYALFSSRMAKF